MACKVTVAVLLLSLVALSQGKPRGRRLLQRQREDRSRGSVKGDPVLTAFDGQEFEFHGKPDHFYNLASEPGAFQVLK